LSGFAQAAVGATPCWFSTRRSPHDDGAAVPCYRADGAEALCDALDASGAAVLRDALDLSALARTDTALAPWFEVAPCGEGVFF
jgi:hypothetical protein